MTSKTATHTPELAQRELADAIKAAESALAALAGVAAMPGAVDKTNAQEFNDSVSALAFSLTTTRAMHVKVLRVVASNASRAKKLARVAEAMALLEAKESAEKLVDVAEVTADVS